MSRRDDPAFPSPHMAENYRNEGDDFVIHTEGGLTKFERMVVAVVESGACGEPRDYPSPNGGPSPDRQYAKRVLRAATAVWNEIDAEADRREVRARSAKKRASVVSTCPSRSKLAGGSGCADFRAGVPRAVGLFRGSGRVTPDWAARGCATSAPPVFGRACVAGPKPVLFANPRPRQKTMAVAVKRPAIPRGPGGLFSHPARRVEHASGILPAGAAERGFPGSALNRCAIFEEMR